MKPFINPVIFSLRWSIVAIMLMESNFFRVLTAELWKAICGARINKIYEPVKDLFIFALNGQNIREQKYLFFRSGENSFLALGRNKPESPLQPSARAMLFRKRLSGKRLCACQVDWPLLRVVFQLSPGTQNLVLSLRAGMHFSEDEVAEQVEPTWPPLEEILNISDIWRQFPQVSPQLRKTLKVLSPMEAAALLEKLQKGASSNSYLYYRDGKPWRLLPWRLPTALSADLVETVFDSPLTATETLLGPIFTGSAGETRNGNAKRADRLLARLEAEEIRLLEIINKQTTPDKLKSHLHCLDARGKHAQVILPPDADNEIIQLDPSLSVIDNMARMFKQVARAKRGLKIIAERKKNILEGKEKIESTPYAGPRQRSKKNALERTAASSQSMNYNKFRRFISSDGFLILRGKNDKANSELLRQARPFDLWFHAEGGPGAHCIVRRPSANHIVPHSTIVEAAVLAGLKSWQVGSGKGQIICCLVKNVHAVKGAAPGTVRVDKIFESLAVEFDPRLEEKLNAER